jgi:hypothetical protein
MQGDSAAVARASQYQYLPPQGQYLPQPGPGTDVLPPPFTAMLPRPSYHQSPAVHWGPGAQWPNLHPRGHPHPLPHHPHSQQQDHWQGGSQQLLPGAALGLHHPPPTLARSGVAAGSHHPLRVGSGGQQQQQENPGGGGVSAAYCLEHTGRESNQAFQDVNLGVAAEGQSGLSAALLHSAPDQAIGPKTEDRDDTDLGDQLQVLSFLFVHRSPSSFACMHSCHIAFRLLFWRLVCNFIDVCILHYCCQRRPSVVMSGECSWNMLQTSCSGAFGTSEFLEPVFFA